MTDAIGPYRILRQLGAGGMGEVFLAEDPRLGRQVALKRPSADLLTSPDAADRLRREARAAAGLSHPGIAAVYDVLDVDGGPHIVMEYVEGETLAQVVARGPVALPRVLDIGVQLADALAAAHAGGIIHRDLKPGNIILTASGRIKVLDFGLARTVRAAGQPHSTITEAGRVLGTPGYMSPEQIVGDRADQRSDIYSAGVVLFELLTGRAPFMQPDAIGRTLAALGRTAAPRADAANPDVPAAIGDIVARAMAPEPGQRFPRAEDLREALARAKASLGDLPTFASGDPIRPRRRPARTRRLVAAGGALALITIGLVAGRAWVVGRRAAPAPSDATVIAVLPFEVISNDPANAYLGVGFADSLITELTRNHNVTVVRRDEVREFSGQNRDPGKVARTVGANLIVDASLQVSGDVLHVNVKLVRADATHAWNAGSQPYEGQTAQMFELQRKIADGVIAGASVSATTKQAGERPGTLDLGAQTSYWQGRALLDRADVPGNIQKAFDAFQAALARDPAFVMARAALGEAALQQYVDTKDRRWYDRALAESQGAVQQDPSQPQAYISLARVYKQDGHADEAIGALRHAIQLEPNNDNAYEVLGETLGATGKTDEGIAALQRAVTLRPRYPNHHTRLGVAYYSRGRYDDAIAELQRVTELQPDNAMGFHRLGTVYQAMGDTTRALASYAQAIQLGPPPQTFFNMGVIQFDAERYAEAASLFEQTVKAKPNFPQYRRNLGDAYRRLKNRLDDAKTQYQTCVKLSEEQLKVNPKSAEDISQAAVCLAKLGQFAEAGRRASEAVALAPKDRTALYRQAVVLSFAGRKAEALSVLDLALANGYSAKLAAGDNDLENIRSLPEFQAILRRHLP
jgi:tetratricopeptide (TPR) repeat protein/TolB-like protein